MDSIDGPTLVFSCEFDEQTEFEAELKGLFEAIAVRMPDGTEIPLAFRDPVRLAQDLDSEIAGGGACIAELVLIVVPRVTRAHMAKAVTHLYKEGFFDRLLAIGQSRQSKEP